MAVTVLLGSPIETITAGVIRNLRSADGAKPCPDGLKVALEWIKGRRIPLATAVVEARQSRHVSNYVDWALTALGYGSGYGSGYGLCYGSGSGDGSGSGYGLCYGYGFGSGSGYGYGDGSGYGSGYGYGE